MNGELPPDRRTDIVRWLMLGALIAPLPLLEIRAPLIGHELGESLRLTLALMAAGVGLGMVGSLFLRRHGHRAEALVALVAGICWIVSQVGREPIVLAAMYVVGLAAGWAAVLAAIASGINGRGMLAAGAVVLVAILVPLAMSPQSDWEPLAAVCGVIAVVAAVVRLRSLGGLGNARTVGPAAAVHQLLPTVPWRSSVSSGVLLAVAAGITWGTTPAINRVTWQQFRAEEEYSSITVLGGALFAAVLATLAARQVRHARGGDTSPFFRREVTGLMIGTAFVVISLAPTLTITMLARALALGGADLLMAGPASHEHPERHAARWPFAAGGIVIGLMISAVVTVTDSIDPRLVVAGLAAIVLAAVAGDLLAGKQAAGHRPPVGAAVEGHRRPVAERS